MGHGRRHEMGMPLLSRFRTVERNRRSLIDGYSLNTKMAGKSLGDADIPENIGGKGHEIPA